MKRSRCFRLLACSVKLTGVVRLTSHRLHRCSTRPLEKRNSLM